MGQKKLSRKRQVILVLSRYPEPGQTKTRLIPFLDPEDSGQLALSFIQDTDRMLGNLKDVDKIWCYSPPTKEVRNFFRRILKFCDGLYPQRGDCFSDRLRNSMRLGFDLGYQRVAHMGTDSPDLPHLWLEEIFVKLEKRDLVIGPALDGGYYLLGMKNVDVILRSGVPLDCPGPKDLDLFHDLAVGSPLVLDQILTRAAACGLSVDLLAPYRDIDRPCDLFDLAHRLWPDRTPYTYLLINEWLKKKRFLLVS